MTMKASSENAVKDFAVSNSNWLILLAVVIGLVAFNWKQIRNRLQRKRPRKGKKTTVAFIVLLTVALSGCTGSGPSQKGDSVDTLESLLDKHIQATCTFTANAQGSGLHADLDECKVTLESGSKQEASVKFSGHDDNLGTAKPNREASISTTIYYPDGDNSIPTTVIYNAENEQVESFTATILAPTKAGFGRYEFAFSIEQFVDANKWWLGIQEKPDPHKPDPVIVTFTAAKDGLFGGGL